MTQQPVREQGGATRGGGLEMPANKRRCRNKRHEEEMEVADAMATTEEDTVGVGMLVAGWEDEDNENRYMTKWDNKSWGLQWTMDWGATRGRGRW
jgi:hypothetical protein